MNPIKKLLLFLIQSIKAINKNIFFFLTVRVNLVHFYFVAT